MYDYLKPYIPRLAELYPDGIEFVEAGCGVPLGAALTSQEGASKVVRKLLMPYSKNVQNLPNGVKSVSQDGIEAFRKLSAYMDGLYAKSRVIVSGSLEQNFNKGRKHAYVRISTFPNGFEDPSVGDYFHIIFHRTLPRSLVSELLHKVICDILLGEDVKPTSPFYTIERWGFSALTNFINSKESGYVMLPVDHKTNDLLYFLRNQYPIYRGSFNPPTNAHAEIGSGNALFEIALDNVDKDVIPLEVIHRVKMLHSLGKNVIITRGMPYYNQLINYVREWHSPNIPIGFRLGFDTYERVFVRDQFAVPNDTNSKFHVYTDSTIDISSDRLTVLSKCGTLTIMNVSHRSSFFRNTKDLSMIPGPVAEYIKENRLYGV